MLRSPLSRAFLVFLEVRYRTGPWFNKKLLFKKKLR